MISIGQLIGRAFGALWRRRLPVLGIVLAWLVLDGLLLSLLKAYQPDFGLGKLHWFRSAYAEASSSYAHGLRLFVAILPEFLRDAIRAVFVVLLLRSLLRPISTDPERLSVGLLKPILLLFLFELAWTAVLYPIEFGVLQMVSEGMIDPRSSPLLVPSVRALVFVAYCMALSRLCFIYANATLGLGLHPGRSWRETNGLAPRLFLLFFLIPLPLAALGGLLKVYSAVLDLTRESIQHYLLARSAIESVDFVLTGVPILAVIAVAYVAATGAPSMAIPGANRTSGQLAEAFD